MPSPLAARLLAPVPAPLPGAICPCLSRAGAPRVARPRRSGGCERGAAVVQPAMDRAAERVEGDESRMRPSPSPLHQLDAEQGQGARSLSTLLSLPRSQTIPHSSPYRSDTLLAPWHPERWSSRYPSLPHKAPPLPTTPAAPAAGQQEGCKTTYLPGEAPPAAQR